VLLRVRARPEGRRSSRVGTAITSPCLSWSVLLRRIVTRRPSAVSSMSSKKELPRKLLTVKKRTPWNKGKLIGARPPLRPKHVWSIKTRLMVEGRIRDLALF
jgi:hypothetical protein